MANERKLKVYKKYFERATQYNYLILPEIRLCGKWLKDMGFECGRSVTIKYVKNKIVITASEETKEVQIKKGF